MSLEEEIKEAIDTEIKPRIQMDGGDVDFVELTPENIVIVRLHGACVGCAAAGMTLKMGIERFIKIKFPEVVEVVAMQ